MLFGNRSTSLPLFFFLFLILASVSEAFAADITWTLYLKQYQGNQPVYTCTGGEFTVPAFSLTSASDAKRLIDALQNTQFILSQSPVSGSLEMRITLNNQGDAFEKPRAEVPAFFNVTVEAYVNGRRENGFRFLGSSPFVITIPASGIDTLLRLSNCGFGRGEDLLMAFDQGTKFSKEGITTSNMISGMSASIAHLSVIVGSRNDLMNLPTTKINTWGKIKILFQ